MEASPRNRALGLLACLALVLALALLVLGGVILFGSESGSQTSRSEPSAAACPRPGRPKSADTASGRPATQDRAPTIARASARAAAPIAPDVNPACAHAADALAAANFDAALTARLGAPPSQYEAAVVARKRMAATWT